MPIHSATITTDGTTTVVLLPDDKSRRWYVIQNRSSDALVVGGAAFAHPDGLYLSPDAVGNGSGGRLEVSQGHENDKTPCHAVRGYGEGSGGNVQVIWATEDSTD